MRRLLLPLGAAACLLAGAGLSTVRLVQPEVGLAVRLVALAPWAVPAYLLALLLLVSMLLTSRARRHLAPRLAPWAALAVAGLVLHGTWLAPLFVGAGEPPADAGPRLRVMTANLLNGTADAEALVRLAEAQDVDLLAVQEVTPTSLLLMEEAGLNEQLPFHAGQALYGVEGTMLYSRFPLSGERAVPTRWTSFVVAARVEGTRFRVLVTHPESPMGNAAQWREDHRVLRETVGTRPPDLLMGDLNATPDHRELRALLDAGLRDAAEQAGSGWQPTWPSAGEVGRGPLSLPPVVTIDHVLVGDGWTATRTRTLEVPGTDHAALVAEVVAP